MALAAPSDAGEERCPWCPMTSVYRNNILTHVRAKHRSANYVETYRSMGLLWCPKCYVTYSKPATMEKHIQSCDRAIEEEIQDETLSPDEGSDYVTPLRSERKRRAPASDENSVSRSPRSVRPSNRSTPELFRDPDSSGSEDEWPQDECFVTPTEAGPDSYESVPSPSSSLPSVPPDPSTPVSESSASFSESESGSSPDAPERSRTTRPRDNVQQTRIDLPERPPGPCPRQKPLRSFAKRKREAIALLTKGLGNLLRVLEGRYTDGQKNHAIYLFNILPSVLAKTVLDTSLESLALHAWILDEALLSPLLPSNPATPSGKQDKHHRVEDLVRAGLVAKALSAIESDASVITDLRPYQAIVQKLHPASTDDDHVPPPSESAKAVQVSKRLFARTLQLLPRGSAVGFSAWTFEIIKVCAADKSFTDRAVRLLNLMATGTAGHADNWLSSRLIGLSKKDGGIRPIAISDAWSRLMGRAISGLMSKQFEQFFAPTQLGVGTPGGAGKIINATRMFSKCKSFDENHLILAVDFSNAFNSLRRGAIAEIVQSKFPELSHLFHWSYGSATPLISEGEVVARSCTGVRQGDPLGPAFFCMGIQDLVSSVPVPSQNQPVSILGYMDDITLMGPTEGVARTFRELADRARARGLRVNPAKCVAFGPPQETMRDEVLELAIPTTSDGIVILGAPIGTDEFCCGKSSDSLEDMLSSLGTITRFHPDVAYLLTAQCVNSRPQHILRSVPPWLLSQAAQAFDRAIDQALQRLCQCTDALPEPAAIIRSLPIRSGGLGMRRASNVAPLAWISSMLQSLPFLESIGLLKPDHMWWSPDIQDVLHRAHPTLHNTNSWAEALELPDDILFRPQRDYLKISDEGARDHLMQVLLEGQYHGGKHHAAWFLSNASPGTGAWLFSAYARTPLLQLSGDDYREGLRLRLLLPATEHIDPSPWSCQCSAAVDERMSPYHCLTCLSLNDSRVFNHENLKNLVVDFAKALSSATKRINHSTTAPLRRISPGSPVLADVVLSKDHWTRYIDVSIANPSADVYVRRGSHETPLLAATDREVCKANKYNACVVPEQAALVVPFVVEATGRFGTRAQAFVDELCNLQFADVQPDRRVAKARRFFTRRLQTAIVVGIARARARWRQRCSLDPPASST